MIAFKGVNQNMQGHGNMYFEVGKTYKEEKSKTVSCGFHCTENPFECLTYFPLGMDNKYLLVEAGGSIDEDESERIACTEITIKKELTLFELAVYGMIYMVEHPLRNGWTQKKNRCTVAADSARAEHSDSIAIARGKNPKVSGVAGSILGIIVEPERGVISGAKIFKVNDDDENKTFSLHLKNGRSVIKKQIMEEKI